MPSRESAIAAVGMWSCKRVDKPAKLFKIAKIEKDMPAYTFSDTRRDFQDVETSTGMHIRNFETQQETFLELVALTRLSATFIPLFFIHTSLYAQSSDTSTNNAI